MANKEKNSIFERPFMRIVLTCLGAVLSTIVLGFSAMTILEVYNNSYETAPKYLIWVFVFVGLLSGVSFLKERTKINFLKFVVLLLFNVALGVIALFAKNNPYIFSLTAGLYCITIAIGLVFNIVQKRNLRSIILNVLIILCVVAFSIGLFSSPMKDATEIQKIVSLECVFIAIVSLIEAAKIAFAQLKVKVLFKIIVSTFSLEILFGLLTMIICFSLVLASVEKSVADATITSFPDALWYCFAVVTTIGFGDMVAKTLIGRVLTVILGLYGLIVVAVITSIIVNFYNETSGKHDQKELKEISKDEKR